MSELKQDDLIKEYEAINDGPFDWGNKTDRAGLFLLASTQFGLNYQAIYKKTDLSYEECREFGWYCRGLHGRLPIGVKPLWRGQRAAYADWFEGDGGALSFLIDAMCLSGLLRRAPA